MPVRPPSHRPVKGGGPLHNPNPIRRLTGRQLQQRNSRLRRRDPLCVKCREVGVVREVHQFDHITPLWMGGLDHEVNIQGLCKEHHDEKTAAEAGERARRGIPARHPQSCQCSLCWQRNNLPIGFA